MRLKLDEFELSNNTAGDGEGILRGTVNGKRKYLSGKYYTWRLDTELIEMIKQCAEENGSSQSVLMRYIINWGCDRMAENEQFMNEMIEASLVRDVSKYKHKYGFGLTEEVYRKFINAAEEYRAGNVTRLGEAIVIRFFKEHPCADGSSKKCRDCWNGVCTKKQG